MRCPTLSELPQPPSDKNGWPWTEESLQLPSTMSDGSPWPKISIVTPSFNQGEFIEKTIRSVLLQGYPNLEYIIMDGGSTDNTVEIIRKYEAWLAHWVSEKDRGQAHAINKGWGISQGNILHWLNSDDILLPRAISEVAKEFSVDDKVQAVSGICSMTNYHGVEFDVKLPRDFNLKYFLRGGECPGQPAIFLRSDLVKKVGDLSEALNYTLDWEYWIRISQIYPSIQARKIKQPLAVWCQWEDCKSVKHLANSYAERISVLERIFNFPETSAQIRQLQGVAYSYCLCKQALALAKQKQNKKAFQFVLKGFAYNPSLFSSKQMARIVLGIISDTLKNFIPSQKVEIKGESS